MPPSNLPDAATSDEPTSSVKASDHLNVPPALPDYKVATAPSDTDQIAERLQQTSLRANSRLELTDAEKSEVQQLMSGNLRVGSGKVSPFCTVQDVKAQLKLLNLFDRLRYTVQSGTDYFDYPTCQEHDYHIDEPGVDAPPPPYIPSVDISSRSSNAKPLAGPESADKVRIATKQLNEQLIKDRRWEIYLNRAAYRLELWLAKIMQVEYESHHSKVFSKEESDDMPDHILPPVDVALMLHAYYLANLYKREDSVRLRSRAGVSFYHYPLHQLAKRAHPTLPVLTDMEPARLHWVSKVTETTTRQPWDLPLQPPTGFPTKAQETRGGSIFGLRVGCPACRDVRYIPWTGIGQDSSESGIGETGWERICANKNGACSQTITAQHLQMRRFIDDFRRWRNSAGKALKDTVTGEPKPAFFMAGTLMNPFTGELATKDMIGEMLLLPIFKNERTRPATRYLVRKAKSDNDLVEIESQAADCSYHLPTFRSWLEKRTFGPLVMPKVQSEEGMSQLSARIALMMRPYEHGNASAYGEGLCDLVTIVQRQTGFNKDIASLGWSSSLLSIDRGDVDVALIRGSLRYHKFLDTLSSTMEMLSPTLDIDLCWHTHLLKQNYAQDTVTNVGRYITHDDAVETSVLKESFDRTAQIWRDRYSQPYSACGCIYNNPGTIKKLKSLLGNGKGEDGQGGNTRWASKMKGKWRAAKDLPGDKDDTIWQDETHASAHSAVVVREEEYKHDKLRQEMVKEWSLGKRREGHESAFVFGFNTPALHSVASTQPYNSHFVSRGAAGSASINAYTLYGTYGLVALGASAGLGGVAFAGMGAFDGIGYGGIGFGGGGGFDGGCGDGGGGGGGC